MIVTVAMSHACGKPSSQIVQVNTSVPKKSVSGVQVNVPSLLQTTVPLVGCVNVVTSKLSSCGSRSLPNTSTTTGVLMLVMSKSSLAITSLSTGLMVTVTVAMSQACGVASSQIWQSNTSTPVKPGFGVQVTVPSGLITTVPLLGWSVMVVMSKLSPFGSSSLFRISIVTGVSWSVVVWSLSAFTPFTTMVTVVSSQAVGVPSSQMV